MASKAMRKYESGVRDLSEDFYPINNLFEGPYYKLLYNENRPNSVDSENEPFI